MNKKRFIPLFKVFAKKDEYFETYVNESLKKDNIKLLKKYIKFLSSP